ncbi:MAG: hypothetical protein JMN24_04310 [gamma proteobacterium endosymbiont of Lamellibrachia anaximandri]|nr:hypothetical protein [gamma proteobacterium endosymbiont of Lamellibrachia anaximandri]MBL3619025.1 hypothetical protein [gamma proteobacterium endosymbiont of Lamellibrachia anaximandri]
MLSQATRDTFCRQAAGPSEEGDRGQLEELKQLKAQRREEYLQSIPTEGKFGQGKNGYRLNYIQAKRADTSEAWINSIFLVMNLLILLRIFFALGKRGVGVVRLVLSQVVMLLLCHQLQTFRLPRCSCQAVVL